MNRKKADVQVERPMSDPAKDLRSSLHLGFDAEKGMLAEQGIRQLTADEIAWIAAWLAGEGFVKS